MFENDLFSGARIAPRTKLSQKKKRTRLAQALDNSAEGDHALNAESAKVTIVESIKSLKQIYISRWISFLDCLLYYVKKKRGIKDLNKLKSRYEH